jgi:hypothetical protein
MVMSEVTSTSSSPGPPDPQTHVTPSRHGRVQRCDEAQARLRLDQAKTFLDVAELVADEADASIEYGSVAASVAVLAGIAAADAACCRALGKRSRSDDHRDAEKLLGEIPRGGKRAGRQLRRLVDLKDSAQYGFTEFAEIVLQG